MKQKYKEQDSLRSNLCVINQEQGDELRNIYQNSFVEKKKVYVFDEYISSQKNGIGSFLGEFLDCMKQIDVDLCVFFRQFITFAT